MNAYHVTPHALVLLAVVSLTEFVPVESRIVRLYGPSRGDEPPAASTTPLFAADAASPGSLIETATDPALYTRHP